MTPLPIGTRCKLPSGRKGTVRAIQSDPYAALTLVELDRGPIRWFRTELVQPE